MTLYQDKCSSSGARAGHGYTIPVTSWHHLFSPLLPPTITTTTTTVTILYPTNDGHLHRTYISTAHIILLNRFSLLSSCVWNAFSSGIVKQRYRTLCEYECFAGLREEEKIFKRK